jgi:hypothetical protein
MVRRLLVVFAVLAGSALLATPVSAAPATSSTQNFHGAFPPFHVDSSCGAPAGTIVGTGNAVMHITVNAAGDVWITSTQEEWFTLTPDTGTVVYTGHFATWFGLSLNRNNGVMHDVLNVHATGSDGSTVTFNLVDHLSMSANGQINMFTACH